METENQFAREVEALDRLRSIKSAAAELGIEPSTLRRRIKRSGFALETLVSPRVRGRNAGIKRVMLDGGIVNLGTPMSEQIVIEDVVRGLSRTGWNSGQTHGYFSLAAVSVLFAEHISRKTKDADLALTALLWYGYAAFIGYIPRILEDKMTGNWHSFKRLMRMAVEDSQDQYLTAALHEDFFEEENRTFESMLEKTLCRGESLIQIGFSSSTRLDETLFMKHLISLRAIEEILANNSKVE